MAGHMRRRDTNGRITTTGSTGPAVILCLLAQAALADEEVLVASAEAASLQVDLPPSLSISADAFGTATGGLSGALLPDGGFAAQSAAGVAPAPELAEGLDVQVHQKRRKFRTRAVNWVSDRSSPVGVMTDFLLSGADSGWHLAADVTGTDEYVLEWKTRFR